MKLIAIYDGPTLFCEMLKSELGDRGITAIVRAVGPFLGIIGDVAQAPFSELLVSDRDYAEHRAAVDDCVAMVAVPLAEGELEPSEEDDWRCGSSRKPEETGDGSADR